MIRKQQLAALTACSLFALFLSPLPSMAAAEFEANVTSNIAFSTIIVRGDTDDVAMAIISPANGSFTPDPGAGGGSAAITNNAGAQTRAVVEATLLPVDTVVTVSYNTKVNLSNGMSAFDTALLDNCDDPDVGVGGTAGSMTEAGVVTPGSATTDGTGQLTFGIGASIATQPGVTYGAGDYNIGGFNVTITY